MKSCLYEGQVKHSRYTPKPHSFQYRIFYVYLDLDELDTVFNRLWLWSAKKFSLAWFREKDHEVINGMNLKNSIYQFIEDKTGKRPSGPVRLLTQLRYFGYVFNPVSFYYCFNKDDNKVETIVAEVNNTPWGERHMYILPATESVGESHIMKFLPVKEFHVSPFMQMDINYEWGFNQPDNNLAVSMKNFTQGEMIFDAVMGLKKKKLSSRNCASALIRFPFMTLKIITAIYWQALKLLLKGTPVYDHPDKENRTFKEGA